jgi:hypothetical protein
MLPRTALLLLATLLTAGSGARAWELAGGRLELHGYGEVQLRTYAEDFDHNDFVLSQWANVLDLELEADVAPDGFGPFDLISAFARVEARYECVYRGCGLPVHYFGNDAGSAPRNLTTGRSTSYTGLLPVVRSRRIHTDNELVDFFAIPPFDRLRALGADNLEQTFAPIADARFAVKKIDASLGSGTFPLGPWKFKSHIDPIGSLRSIPNLTALPASGLPALPLRPAVPAPGSGGELDPQGLFVPSTALRERFRRFDDFEQNFDQHEMAWNHGQGQDEKELKELYLDLELLEGRLWIRAGKQSIVWGKTELFRTTDQFNPQDLALSSLPSLEESRLPLWSLRGVYSFYDVGPLEDVRLELAMNVDDFEPIDLGRCGEPYTVWLVCAKTFGLWAHGFAGVGLAGEERPPDPGESWRAFEAGARVEFRYGRFSFQISDFIGYEDAPVIDYFGAYERRVDPRTGRPLDVHGRPLLGQSPEDVLAFHPGNRQLFDVICSATLGIAGGLIESLGDACLVNLPNSQANIGVGITPASSLGRVIGGSGGPGFTGEAVVRILTLAAGSPVAVDLVELNKDPNDGPGTPLPPPANPSTAAQALAAYLTDEQEALFGCGAFYGTDCDVEGVDLFNAEASVLLQAFPQFEPGGAVATRPVDGVPLTLPGANGPLQLDGSPNPAWSALVDGCIGPGFSGCNAGDFGRPDDARALLDPRTGQPFANELAAASYNFMLLLAALGVSTGNDPDCDVADPITCLFVRGIFDIAGATRPEVRAGGNGTFGRRDFVWSGGSEISVRYLARNVLGLAFDFAEDRTKTNWSVEATWIDDQPYAVTDELRGFSRNDTYNLTFSVDRPTFVNFLNPGRTFFVNSQWFMRWIDDYRGGGRYLAHGPFALLGTLTLATGYHQDRLLPVLTWVHDLRSTSGGLIGQVTYRFSNEFSATLGIAGFYGHPEPIRVPLRQPLPSNVGGTYQSNNRYNGLSPIAERDEVFVLLRYTF